MRKPPAFRPPGWDLLEDRIVPSQGGGTAAAGMIRASDYATTDAPASTIPTQRLDAAAVEAHASAVARADSGGASNVVFFGDSITERWDKPGSPGVPVWNASIAPLSATDFGLDGDRTQNLIWRLQNGELDGQPRVAVVLIGTNNLVNSEGDESPDETVAGITAVVQTIRDLSPQTKVLLLSLLPRSTPDDPVRGEIEQVNGQISGLQDWAHVFYGDVGWLFRGPDGAIPADLIPDGIHPSQAGYQLLADVLQIPLAALLGLPAPDPSTFGGPILVDIPSNRVVEASDPSGARFAFPPPLAFDAVDPNPVVTVDPPPDSVLPLGMSLITATATDRYGHSASASYLVEVRDTPVLHNPPSSRVVQAIGRGAVVFFKPPTATDVANSKVKVTSSVPRGSFFGLGTTVVTFTATGVSGVVASVSMSITVVARTPPSVPPRRVATPPPAAPGRKPPAVSILPGNAGVQGR